MAAKNIKAVIFDLGGVLLNIRYGAAQESFKALGVENIEALYSQASQSNLFDHLETGFSRDIDFYNGLRSYISSDVTDKQLRDAWNSMLLDLPPHRVKFLQDIRSTYKSYLLSNTNAIHVAAFNQIIQAENNLPDLFSLFHKVYFSHEIGLRKPDAKAFLLILKENGLRAEQTVFIDDSIQHIEAAKQLGIRAYLLSPEEDVTTLWERIEKETEE